MRFKCSNAVGLTVMRLPVQQGVWSPRISIINRVGSSLQYGIGGVVLLFRNLSTRYVQSNIQPSSVRMRDVNGLLEQ
jgi:hypothetical protein